MTSTAAHTLVVIPCAAAKNDGTHAAADLYASPNFAHMLRSAQAYAADAVDSFGEPVQATVMILSAHYGLVALDQALATYDTKMGDAGCITPAGVTAQLAELAPSAIEALLPGAYFRTLAAAVELSNDDEDNAWISLLDAFEAAPGIGYQRGVAGQLARPAA
jgi:hypothetical protein